MKKHNFIALVFGTLGGAMFSLGMCMALLPQWDSFGAGVALGIAGMVVALVTLIAWCRAENKQLPKINGKNLLRILYGVLSALVLGTGMCLCLVWGQIIAGTLVGLLGIMMLIFMIPMIKGIK